MTDSTAKNYAPNDFIPMAEWGKDHISTMAYAETVMVECGSFQVGSDPRMRANRRNFRVMHEECPQPKRPGGRAASLSFAGPMRPEHGSRLRDTRVVDWHDDWACIQDAANEGLFTVGPDAIQPGEELHLSVKGAAYCAALRTHKAAGGQFATFVFDCAAAAVPEEA